jgi:DNA-directed RNA polymerase subunit RPC12/RpoP
MDAQQSPYVAMTVSCSHCKERQLVYVRERRMRPAPADGPSRRSSPQTVECLKCHRGFDAMASGKIIAGPFRGES